MDRAVPVSWNRVSVSSYNYPPVVNYDRCLASPCVSFFFFLSAIWRGSTSHEPLNCFRFFPLYPAVSIRKNRTVSDKPRADIASRSPFFFLFSHFFFEGETNRVAARRNACKETRKMALIKLDSQLNLSLF